MVSQASHSIGRFAPSPSGPLHFGSLVAALGSYLDARSQQGSWLVRMEDIDPPREQPGAADDILRTLEAFGLTWDGRVMYQSERSEAYAQALSRLEPHLFYCTCTRAQLRPHGGIYPGTCHQRRTAPPGASAVRLRSPVQPPAFIDRAAGTIELDRVTTGSDPVLRRKDGLWAYQLAVVVDDAAQGITHVVRGHDLLTTTPLQIWLQQCLQVSTPSYLNLPVVTGPDGRKLSKQNHAPGLSITDRDRLLTAALHILGLTPEPELGGAELLPWAIQAWPERTKTAATIAIESPDRLRQVAP